MLDMLGCGTWQVNEDGFLASRNADRARVLVTVKLGGWLTDGCADFGLAWPMARVRKCDNHKRTAGCGELEAC
jgi:hypothetical protein